MGLDNPVHLAFLAILLLVVFGAKRLPEIGHSLGAGMRGFRDSLSGEPHPTAGELGQDSDTGQSPSATGAQLPSATSALTALRSSEKI
jgi:sec-independent protein translocase protein TatA